MSDTKKILGGVLALFVIVGLYVIAMFYTSSGGGDMSSDMGRQAVRDPEVPAVASRPVPETPDTVADDILEQASVDGSALDEENGSVDALLEDDRSSIDNIGNLYEEAEL